MVRDDSKTQAGGTARCSDTVQEKRVLQADHESSASFSHRWDSDGGLSGRR